MGGILQRLRAWPARRWLFMIVAVYFAAALYGGWFNYVSLHFNSTGVYDLSINQQALSSTIHGNYPYPFYEATNCGRNDRCSFLLVHPVFIAYLVAVPYALAPSAVTLFAIQDLVLALAAIPLFGITRMLTKSNRLALLSAAVYLVWLPAFSGIFSFHWEAFLPLEMFTIFYLFLNGKYLETIPLVIFTYLTLEIGSVFLFFLGLFFLVPWLPMLPRYLWTELRVMSLPKGPTRDRLGPAMRSLRGRLFGAPLVQASLSLMIGSVLAYVLLHEFVSAGGGLLGLPPLPPEYQIPLTQPVHAATFTLANFLYQWPQKLVFWLVMFATLGFLPWLAPRTAVLWGPWVAYTTLTTAGFYHMGNQYGFLAASVLFIGFVYGLVRLQGWANGTHVGTFWSRFWYGGAPISPVAAAPGAGPSSPPFPASSASGRPAAPPPAPAPSASPSLAWTLERRRRRSWQWIGALSVSIIAVNLAFNPLIPINADLRLDKPFAAQPNLGITGLPDMTDYQNVRQLVGLIPSNAFVAVSPDLFTFLTANPHAYPMVSDLNSSYFPFGEGAPNITQPQYVLLAVHGGTILPPWLHLKGPCGNVLYRGDPSTATCGNVTDREWGDQWYGVSAWIPDGYLGGVLLFQWGYSGPAQLIGNWPAFTGITYTVHNGMLSSQAGVVVDGAGPTGGPIITTAPIGGTIRKEGRVFDTADLSLGAGLYNVTLRISGQILNTTAADAAGPTADATTLRLASFEYAISQLDLIVANFTGNSGWQNVTFQLNLTNPVSAFTVIGTNQRDWFAFSVESVTVVPVVPE